MVQRPARWALHLRPVNMAKIRAISWYAEGVALVACQLYATIGIAVVSQTVV
jgi:hypothetical protein